MTVKVEDLVLEFKRSGRFDEIRKQLLDEFSSSPSGQQLYTSLCRLASETETSSKPGLIGALGKSALFNNTRNKIGQELLNSPKFREKVEGQLRSTFYEMKKSAPPVAVDPQPVLVKDQQPKTTEQKEKIDVDLFLAEIETSNVAPVTKKPKLTKGAEISMPPASDLPSVSVPESSIQMETEIDIEMNVERTTGSVNLENSNENNDENRHSEPHQLKEGMQVEEINDSLTDGNPMDEKQSDTESRDKPENGLAEDNDYHSTEPISKVMDLPTSGRGRRKSMGKQPKNKDIPEDNRAENIPEHSPESESKEMDPTSLGKRRRKSRGKQPETQDTPEVDASVISTESVSNDNDSKPVGKRGRKSRGKQPEPYNPPEGDNADDALVLSAESASKDIDSKPLGKRGRKSRGKQPQIPDTPEEGNADDAPALSTESAPNDMESDTFDNGRRRSSGNQFNNRLKVGEEFACSIPGDPTRYFYVVIRTADPDKDEYVVEECLNDEDEDDDTLPRLWTVGQEQFIHFLNSLMFRMIKADDEVWVLSQAEDDGPVATEFRRAKVVKKNKASARVVYPDEEMATIPKNRMFKLGVKIRD